MARKPALKIAVVGAGNFGSVLAIALHHAGLHIEVVIARPTTASLKKASRLAKQVAARSAANLSKIDAEVVWFCVPDSEIRRAAGALAEDFSWKGKVALHSSGALTSDELDLLRQKGATVASVHPLMTFVRGSSLRQSRLRQSRSRNSQFQDSRYRKSPKSYPALAGVPFAIEGDPAAVRAAQQIVRQLGGRSYPIRKQDKAAYHAWGTFASPLLTALIASAEQVAALTGVKGTDARQRMSPILLQTVTNYASFGAAGAFSGPIVRGDVETVTQHLKVLKDTPLLRDVYLSLARAALEFLPAKNKRALKQILASSAGSA